MKITLEQIKQRIENADNYEINEIMDAVRKRYDIAFPDLEVIYLAYPKNDPEQRQKILDYILRHLMQ